HALLEHRVRRIADAAVDMAGTLQVEQRGRMVARFEDEGGGEVDRHRAGARRGVGRSASVQRERVEAGVSVTSHGQSISLVGSLKTKKRVAGRRPAGLAVRSGIGCPRRYCEGVGLYSISAACL